MSASLVPASVLLREAAEHIEVVGLNKDGGMYRAPEGKSTAWMTEAELVTAPCCAMGALSQAYRKHDDDPNACALGTYNARLFLYEAPEINPVGSIAEWNDAPTTTQADVLRVLRETADRAERAGA